MGWTSTWRSKGRSNLDYFSRELNSDEGRVRDCATVSGTAYIAYDVTKPGETPKTVALVVLTRWVPRPTDGYNFSTKLIDESMGPVERRCPQRILDLLTPVPYCGYSESGAQYAQEWRDGCTRYHTRRQSVPRVPKGAHVRFERPITFTHGLGERQVLIYTGRGSLFDDPQSEHTLRLRRWRDLAFTIIDPTEAVDA